VTSTVEGEDPVVVILLFQYPQRIVGDFNNASDHAMDVHVLCFSILNGSWVTSTQRDDCRMSKNPCFSILNGSWVTSTGKKERKDFDEILFQYPQRIVGDFNHRAPCGGTAPAGVSVSSTDRG